MTVVTRLLIVPVIALWTLLNTVPLSSGPEPQREAPEMTSWTELVLRDVDGNEITGETRIELLREFRDTSAMSSAFFDRTGSDHETDDASTWGPESPEQVDWTGFADFEAAADLLTRYDEETLTHYMNDDLREQVHSELAPCAFADFLARYIALHREQYGEEFQIN